MAVKTRKFAIEINTKWCKGCEICVNFCPRKVFAMQNGKAKAVDVDACTGCQLCEIYCPDFAVHVTRCNDTENN